ncbi:MAG TPA: Rrf2 family transcriptional regulator [Anaeromyxobacteraceae bacterium]|nr:Rrf2 family transcriptional regulator [Anaeromyxobacteraceae bacterium]
MMFSASTTHALRAVAWLAAHGDGRTVMGRELAQKLKLPPDYLTKVLGTLARNGVLNASRGVKGGYRLAKPPERIRLAEVIKPFEGKRTRPGCLLRPERRCRDSGACSAHATWADVKRVYLRFLEESTVADIRGGA